jgi:hypothetical protein
MIATYAIGITALVALALAWTVVQRAWVRAFPGVAPGGDALAGRRCDGCLICVHRCKDQPVEPVGSTRVEEES